MRNPIKLRTLIFFGAAILVGIACESDSDDAKTNAELLVGTWQLTAETTYYGSSVSGADSSTVSPSDELDGTFIFNSDGTGSLGGNGISIQITYTASETEFTWTADVDGFVFSQTSTYIIDGTTMTITSHLAAGEGSSDAEEWVVSVLEKL